MQVDGFKPAGTVRFVGTSAETHKPRIGIELDAPEGRMDGSQKGVFYFTCDKTDGKYGVLAAPKLVHAISQQGKKLPRDTSVPAAKSHKYVKPVVSLGKFADEVKYVNESGAAKQTRRTSYAEVDKKMKKGTSPAAKTHGRLTWGRDFRSTHSTIKITEPKFKQYCCLGRDPYSRRMIQRANMVTFAPKNSSINV